MDGGGGDTNVTQTTTNKPSPYVAPYLNPFMGQALSVAMQPYESYPGQQVAGLNPDQQNAFQMARDQAGAGQGLLGGAQSTLSGIASGASAPGSNPLLGMNNPYLQQTVDALSGDVTRNYQNAVAPGTDAAFARAGAFGGSAWQDAVSNNQHQLTEDLGNIANNARMQNYGLQAQLGESDLNRRQAGVGQQMQAASLIPGLIGAGYQNAQGLLGVGNQEAAKAKTSSRPITRTGCNSRAIPTSSWASCKAPWARSWARAARARLPARTHMPAIRWRQGSGRPLAAWAYCSKPGCWGGWAVMAWGSLELVLPRPR